MGDYTMWLLRHWTAQDYQTEKIGVGIQNIENMSEKGCIGAVTDHIEFGVDAACESSTTAAGSYPMPAPRPDHQFLRNYTYRQSSCDSSLK